ncbi:LOW QUALITY PROTEIN: hypothetical protein CVT26_007323 [Gymnopilus dilepis]|uniref:Uncharacterized protein n=1 Tax=Gymnopilus dilepis TaxID=231916 RepID=A0A409W1M7_9AGAR|nr:LOW QUALITY PROTEIN: hypothetical protein CVT26_007323 [Gymnopilus dilepis]
MVARRKRHETGFGALDPTQALFVAEGVAKRAVSLSFRRSDVLNDYDQLAVPKLAVLAPGVFLESLSASMLPLLYHSSIVLRNNPLTQLQSSHVAKLDDDANPAFMRRQVRLFQWPSSMVLGLIIFCVASSESTKVLVEPECPHRFTASESHESRACRLWREAVRTRITRMATAQQSRTWKFGAVIFCRASISLSFPKVTARDSHFIQSRTPRPILIPVRNRPPAREDLNIRMPAPDVPRQPPLMPPNRLAALRTPVFIHVPVNGYRVVDVLVCGDGGAFRVEAVQRALRVLFFLLLFVFSDLCLLVITIVIAFSSTIPTFLFTTPLQSTVLHPYVQHKRGRITPINEILAQRGDASIIQERIDERHVPYVDSLHGFWRTSGRWGVARAFRIGSNRRLGRRLVCWLNRARRYERRYAAHWVIASWWGVGVVLLALCDAKIQYIILGPPHNDNCGLALFDNAGWIILVASLIESDAQWWLNGEKEERKMLITAHSSYIKGRHVFDHLPKTACKIVWHSKSKTTTRVRLRLRYGVEGCLASEGGRDEERIGAPEGSIKKIDKQNVSKQSCRDGLTSGVRIAKLRVIRVSGPGMRGK